MLKGLWIVFDVDGVITDGRVYVNTEGNNEKCMNLKDVDAIWELSRRGCQIAAITAEKDNFTKWIKKRFPWKVFWDGESKKGEAIKRLRKQHNIAEGKLIYVGDGKKDLSAFKEADICVCPMDAIEEVKKRADFVLSKVAGSGVLWEVVQCVEQLGNRYDCESKKIWLTNIQEHGDVVQKLLQNKKFLVLLEEMAELFLETLRKEKRIFLIGNGGSAADAAHIAAEFIGRFQKERKPWDVEALGTNNSLLTAVANDYGYEEVFARHIQGVIKEGDLVIGISTSGKSENVLKALHIAKKMGGNTALWTGAEADLRCSDVCLQIPSVKAARIQEMHILIGHYLADYVEQVLVREERESKDIKMHPKNSY